MQHEIREIVAVVQMEQKSQSTNYVKMFFGIGSGDVHLGRRIQLAFWLQVLMQYGTGIAAAVVYSGTIYRTAGFDDVKSNWLSALCMTVGILGTAIAAFTLDRVGRRRTLYWGAVVLSGILFAMCVAFMFVPFISILHNGGSQASFMMPRINLLILHCVVVRLLILDLQWWSVSWSA